MHSPNVRPASSRRKRWYSSQQSQTFLFVRCLLVQRFLISRNDDQLYYYITHGTIRYSFIALPHTFQDKAYNLGELVIQHVFKMLEAPIYYLYGVKLGTWNDRVRLAASSLESTLAGQFSLTDNNDQVGVTYSLIHVSFSLRDGSIRSCHKGWQMSFCCMFFIMLGMYTTQHAWFFCGHIAKMYKLVAL